PGALLHARWIETPLGTMLAVAGKHGLMLLEFVERAGLERELQRVRRKIGGTIVPGESKVLHSVEDQLRQYFEGKLSSFDVPLDLCGSEFEHAVWKALLR